jgi:hypothetical protein
MENTMNQKTTDPHAGESFDEAVQRAADGAAAPAKVRRYDKKIITQVPEWATPDQIEYLMDTFDDAVNRLIRPRSATETEAFYEGHSAQYWYDQLSNANAEVLDLRNENKQMHEIRERQGNLIAKYQLACIATDALADTKR